MSVFLKATFQNLLQLVYAVPPEQIQALLPAGLEPMLVEGKAQLILSALEFRQTRVKGLKIPFHVNFPEVHLKTMVRHDGQTGVFFIRQFVPKHCIAVVARRIYHEPYEAYPIEFSLQPIPGPEEGTTIRELNCRIWKKEHSVTIRAYVDSPHTETEPLQEEWVESLNPELLTGFGRNDKGELTTYTMEQKALQAHRVSEWSLTGDLNEIFRDCLPEGFPEYPVEVLFIQGQAVRITQPLKPMP